MLNCHCVSCDRYNNSSLLQRVTSPAVRWMRLRFAVILRLGDRLMQLGSGIVWPLYLLLVRLLRPVISVCRPAVLLVAAPLSSLYSTVGGAGGAGAMRQVVSARPTPAATDAPARRAVAVRALAAAGGGVSRKRECSCCAAIALSGRHTASA